MMIFRNSKRNSHLASRPSVNSKLNRRRRGHGTAIHLETLENRVVLTGTWSGVTATLPAGNIGTMLLLTNGEIMANAAGVSANWYELTPSSTGSYTDGTWTATAPMNTARQDFGSAVLPDGRLLVIGGKESSAGANTNTGEIYDPTANTWTAIAAAPVTNLGAAPLEVLNDGNVLVGSTTSDSTYLYHPSSNTWTFDSTKLHGDSSANESWVKLSDGSILTYAIGGSTPQAGQRFVPGANNSHGADAWTDAGTVPVKLDSQGGNSAIVPVIGPAVHLADGRVLYLGASGATALYTPPSSGNATGSWVAGPTLKNASGTTIGAFNAPAAVEPNGKVLIAAGPINGNTPTGPTTLLEYDPGTNAFTVVSTTNGPSLSGSTAQDRMLVLPTGQVLFANGSPSLYAYTADSPQLNAQAPAITNIVYTGGSSFTLTGTQLNGFSEGAAYGSNASMASNYPIVKITDASGNVGYEPTTGWTSTGVGTGSALESVNFKIPGLNAGGIFSIQVIGAGVASQTAMFTFLGDVTLDTSGSNLTTITEGNASASTTAGQGGIFVVAPATVKVLSSFQTVPIIISPYNFNNGNGTGITIGSNNNSQNILGPVTISTIETHTRISVTDGSDTSQHTVSLDASTTNGQRWGTLTGLTPGLITYANCASFSFIDSQAGDTINVRGTNSLNTVIDGGGGNDTVTVFNLPSLGPVRLANSNGGSSALTVDDSLSGSGPGLIFSNAEVSTTSGPVLQYDVGSSGTLKYIGNQYADTIYIRNTSTGPKTTIDAGAGQNAINIDYTSLSSLIINNTGGGQDTVTIGGNAPNTNGTIAKIGGSIQVSNTSGSTNLVIGDSGDNLGQTYSLTATGLTINPPPNQPASQVSVGLGSGISRIEIDSGSGGDTFNISDVVPNLVIKSGAGNDTINVDGTHQGLSIIDQGGTNAVTIGSLAPNIGGTLATILGPVSVGGTAGTTTMIVDDSADSTPRTVTMAAGIIHGLTASPISFGGHTNLTLNLGSGGNTLTVTDDSIPANSAIGPITLNGGAKGDALIIDDSASTAGNAYGLASNTYTHAPNPPITFNYFKNTTIKGGQGNNTYTVYSPVNNVTISNAAGTATLHGPNSATTWTVNGANAGQIGGLSFSGIKNLVGGSAADTFVFTNAGSLSGSLDGGSGSDVIDESALTTSVAVNLATATITGVGGTFANIEGVIAPSATNNTFTGANGGSAYNITAKNTGTVNTKFAFTNFQNLNGGSANDTFTFQPTTTLTGSIDGGGGTNTLDFSPYTWNINVNLATHTATPIGGTFANVLVIKGGTASNALTGPAAGTTFNITGANAGNAAGVTFSSFGALVGGAGNDTFKFGTAGSVSGNIYGGSGIDMVDYSAFTNAVNVNLASGSATGVGGTVSKVESVKGGSGNDTITGEGTGGILIGGPGDDTINGGSGRSILIGGTGVDTLTGGSNDDILIGGTTSFDNNIAALDTILAEWQSSNSYATRVSHIKNGGGLNGSNKLILGSTVIDDAAANILTGGAGTDWFFKGTKDQVKDFKTGEQVN